MARLHVHYQKPSTANDTSEDFPDHVRNEWIERMQAELRRTADDGVISADFETAAGLLRLDATRHGAALAAAWSAGDPAERVAFSVFLHGMDGGDDAAAMAALRANPELAGYNPKTFNGVLAKERPCVWTVFGEDEWSNNGWVELAATALAGAMMGSPGGVTKLVPEIDPTPEELEADRREMEAVGQVFKLIQNDWVRRKKLRYTVRPSERVSGRPVSEIMHVKFWVGVQGQGRTLGINGLVALFLWLGDYLEQAPGLEHMKKPKLTHRINMRPEPSTIAAALPRISMTEPD